jgi:hypothetical protein
MERPLLARTADIRLTENAIRTTFRLDGAIAVDTHNSKFVRGLTHVRYPAKCRFKPDIAPRFLIGIVW